MSSFFTIDALCDQFEAAWRSDPRLTIGEFQAQTAPEFPKPLLQALLEVELDLRPAYGEVVSVDDYRTRFPEQLAAVEERMPRFSDV